MYGVMVQLNIHHNVTLHRWTGSALNQDFDIGKLIYFPMKQLMDHCKDFKGSLELHASWGLIRTVKVDLVISKKIKQIL